MHAAAAHAQDRRQFALAAAAAAVLAPPTAVDIGLETVTLFGGIGYTWEHDVHLYWRRAMSLGALLGPRGDRQRHLTGLARCTERRHDLRLEDEPDGLRPWVAETLAAAGNPVGVPAAGLSVMVPEPLAADRSTTSVLRFQYCG